MENNIQTVSNLIDNLERERALASKQLAFLIDALKQEEPDDKSSEVSPKSARSLLYEKARKVRHKYYGRDVYLRGLIEFTNYCKNDCYYCGIRRSNQKVSRYRLDKEQIIDCASRGYDLGFRTFVLQGGEDMHYSDDDICSIVSHLREKHPDCAITLSIGEREYDSYKRYFDAGADRYLLRQETSNPEHYAKLHPRELSIENRKRCLLDLKAIGYQVGCGIMVGSPYQTTDDIVEDILYMKEFDPQMVGIGPFIAHSETPFASMKSGGLYETLDLLAIIRLMLPSVLLPATTALGTIDPKGRELGILAGANVVMPNLSPVGVRKKYMLYDGKICTGDEAAECRRCMERRIAAIGYNVKVSRGDYVARD